MNRISIALLGLTLFCVACTKSEKQTPNGFKFVVLDAGDGVVAKSKEILIFEYVLKDSKDSVWSDTYTQGFPAAVPIADSTMIPMEKGMVQMFRMLSKGDSVRASMSIQKFFQDIAGGPAPFQVDTTLTMSYIIRVTDILTPDKFQEFRSSLEKKMLKKQNTKDAGLIEKYLAEKNIKAESDSSGLRYVIHRSKGGAKPTVQNCVEVSYRGTFLDGGQVFDQNPKMSFPLSRVIPGWQVAIPKLGIGDSATFYIPSDLAYGPQPQGGIPPNAILIFDVALLGFGNGFDQATGTCN